jgi:hypothetical protein
MNNEFDNFSEKCSAVAQGDEEERPTLGVSLFMLHNHLCDVHLRHTAGVYLYRPHELYLTVRGHDSSEVCYFCRRTSCCASCCPGEVFDFGDAKVNIPNREIVPGSLGSISGSLSDIFCTRRGSIYDCLSIGGKINLLRYCVSKGWVCHNFFVMMFEKHIKQQTIVVDQSLDYYVQMITHFGSYLSEAFGDVYAEVMNLISDTFKSLMTTMVSTLAGLFLADLQKSVFDALAEKLRVAKDVVVSIVMTFVRFILGYPTATLFMELIWSNLAYLPAMVPVLLQWASSFMPTQTDVVDQGPVEDMAGPLLSALCMMIYSGSSSKHLTVANAVALNRIVLGMLPKNIGDYVQYVPLIGNLMHKTTLENAMAACPGTWQIIDHNLVRGVRSDKLNAQEIRALQFMWNKCLEERADRTVSDAWSFLKRMYPDALKAPAALSESLCRPRLAPYCICLYGKTAVGKSNQAEKLAWSALFMLSIYDPEYVHLKDQLIKDMALPEEERSIKISDYVYTFTGVADHWDGYTCQPIIIMSDFLSAVEVAGSAKAENLLRLKDTAPYLLKMASLTDKGRFAEPKLLILTTNVPINSWEVKLNKVSNNARAYLSRVDAYLEVNPIHKTVDGRLAPIADTDSQCYYIGRRPGKNWDYKETWNMTWPDVLYTMRGGLRQSISKQVCKEVHETRNVLMSLVEDPDMDLESFRKHFHVTVEEFEGKEEEEEEDVHDQGFGWLFGSKGSSEDQESCSSRGSVEMKQFDIREAYEEEPDIVEHRRGEGFVAAFKEYFRSEKEERYCFWDYYEPYDEERDWGHADKACSRTFCNHSDPFKCPYVAINHVDSESSTWVGDNIDPKMYFKFKRKENVNLTGPLIAASMALVVLGYKYYKEKTQKTIQDMESVNRLNIGKRSYKRVTIPTGDKFVKIYVDEKEESLVLEGVEQKKRDFEEVKNTYLPRRVIEKCPKMEKNIVEVVFGESSVRHRCFAVSDVRFLALGHYVRDPNQVPDMCCYTGNSVINLRSRNCTSRYDPSTDLLIISIVGGSRLPCSNIVDYFRESSPNKGVIVRRLDKDNMCTAMPVKSVRVSNVLRTGLFSVECPNSIGDCGIPYLFPEDLDACIAGIHSAGDNSQTSYFIPIMRHQISDANNQGITLPPPPIVGESRQDFVSEFEEFVPCGKSEFRCVLPHTNSHSRIPSLHKDLNNFWLKKYDLCKLDQFVLAGEVISPARVRLKKLTKGLKFKSNNLPHQLVDCIVSSIAAAINRHKMRNVPYKPGYDFVIEDHEEYKWIGMDCTKSAGPMIGGLKRNLVDEFGKLENWVLLLLLEIENSIVKERKYPVVVRGYTLKDEKLLLEKVATGTSRLFAPDDAIFYLLCKKYFFQLVVFVNLFGKDIGIMTGMTPEQLGEEFLKIFDSDQKQEGVDVDVSGMECGHSEQSILLIMKLMIQCQFVNNNFATHDVHPQLPLLSGDSLVCWVLLNITLYGYCVIADQTFKFRDGALGSGSLLTFILNCFVLLYIVGLHYKKIDCYAEFHDAIIEGKPKWMLFGDDSIVKGTPEGLVEAYRDMGFEATGADKGALVAKSYRELTFCGRSFTYHETTGPTMKLELDRIVKGVQFTKREKFIEIYPNQVYSFLFELARHDSEVWKGVLEDFCLAGCYLRDYISSREDYQRAIVTGESLYDEVLRWIVVLVNSDYDLFQE